MPEPINPTAWLWQQLESLLTPLQLARLRQDFQAQQQRYNAAAQIRQAKREIALFERLQATCEPDSPKHQRLAERIATRRSKIERLQTKVD